MKTDIYKKIKDKVLEMNALNDEISLIEWNKDEGPKFESVEEMKEFENRFINGGFDYLLDDIDTENSNNMLETFDYSLDNFFFYIYTFKKNGNYITYMSIKNLDEDDSIYNICGNKCSDEKSAHSYFDNLKNIITNNNLDDILEHLLIGVERQIKDLKLRYNELTSES